MWPTGSYSNAIVNFKVEKSTPKVHSICKLCVQNFRFFVHSSDDPRYDVLCFYNVFDSSKCESNFGSEHLTFVAMCVPPCMITVQCILYCR